MSISIVIPTWDRRDLLRACLVSIATNPPVVEFEVVVVDNGSTDGTAEALAALDWPWLRVARNEANLGFAVACNQGAQAARHDVTMFLNNDTRVLPGFADAHVELLEVDPRVGIVGSRIEYPDGRLQHVGVLLVDERDAADPLVPVHRFLGLEPDGLPDTEKRMIYSAVTAACCSVRTAEFMAIGGFDERYVNGYEDVDLCLRYRENGFQIVYEPSSRVVHLESASGSTRALSTRSNVIRFRRRWLGHTKADVVKDGGNVTPLPSLAMRSYEPATTTDVIPTVRSSDDGAVSQRSLPPLARSMSGPGTRVTVVVVVSDGETLDAEGLDAATAGVEIDWVVVANGIDVGADGLAGPCAVVRLETRRTFTAAANEAIGGARGSYVLLLSAATCLAPGGLARMLAAAGSRGAAVGPVAAGGLGLQAVDVWLDPISYGDGFQDGAEAVGSLYGDAANPIGSVDLRGVLLRRDALGAVGGLDVGLSRVASERDLARRLVDAGHEVLVSPGVLAEFPGSSAPVWQPVMKLRPDPAGAEALVVSVPDLRRRAVAFLGVSLGGRDRAWLEEIAGFPVAMIDRRQAPVANRAASSALLRAMAMLRDDPPGRLIVVGEVGREAMHDVQVAAGSRADAEPHLVAQLRRQIAVHSDVTFQWLSSRRPLLDRWGRPERAPVAIGLMSDRIGPGRRSHFSPGSGPVFMVRGSALARRKTEEYLALADHIDVTPGADAAMDALWDVWFAGHRTA